MPPEPKSAAQDPHALISKILPSIRQQLAGGHRQFRLTFREN